MTTSRIFPSTNGPASAITFTGSFISGVIFTLTSQSWFTGYYWWVAASNQSTAPVKCALWSQTSSSLGTLIPGSVVTSGTLTAGQWNFIPIATPIQLSQGYDAAISTSGSSYIAAIGVNGNFPDTSGFWGTGGPGVNGILSGAIFAYSGNGGGGTASPPWSSGQGVFSTGGSDPSVTMPLQVSNVDNFWVDVSVQDTPPAGYTGTYRLWPNKYDASPLTVPDSNVAYNVATEIDISQAVIGSFIHYYSPAGSTGGLATKADIWNINTQASIATITSPIWTTESGSAGSQGSGWLKAQLSANTIIPAGKYRVSVYNANGASGGWNAKDAQTSYFITGSAVNGITSGPLFAPNLAGAQTGTFFPGTGTGTTNAQPVFAFDGTDDFPNFSTGNNPGQVYWVDLEVSLPPSNPVYTISVPPDRILNNIFHRSTRQITPNKPIPVVNVSGLLSSVSVSTNSGTARISKSGLVSSSQVTSIPGTVNIGGIPVIIIGGTSVDLVSATPGVPVYPPPVNVPVSLWRARLINPYR